jgi:hypothetical protein
VEEAIRQAVERIMLMLASRDYRGIEAATRGVRLTAAEVENAVREYGRTVAVPPPEAYDEFLEVVEVRAPGPRRWSVNMPVWTEEEGRSDLTAELTLVDGEEGALVPELDGLHVL